MAHLQSNNIFSSCSFSSGVEVEAEPSSVSSASLSHFCSIRQANEIALVNIFMKCQNSEIDSTEMTEAAASVHLMQVFG